jgi:hypothetical protein
MTHGETNVKIVNAQQTHFMFDGPYLQSCCIKVKLSRYRPLQVPGGFRRLRLIEFLDNRHYEDGKVVSPAHRPSLPPGKIPGTHFC